MDLNYNIELRSLNIKLHLCLNLSRLENFLENIFFSFDYSFNEFV